MLGSVLLSCVDGLIFLLFRYSSDLLGICTVLWLLALLMTWSEAVISTHSFAHRISLDSHILTTDALGSPLRPRRLNRLIFILPALTAAAVCLGSLYTLTTRSAQELINLTISETLTLSIPLWTLVVATAGAALLILAAAMIIIYCGNTLRSSFDAERLQEISFRDFSITPASRSPLQRFSGGMSVLFRKILRTVLFLPGTVYHLLNTGTQINLEKLSLTRRMLVAAVFAELSLGMAFVSGISNRPLLPAALVLAVLGLCILLLFTLISRMQQYLTRASNRRRALLALSVLMAMILTSFAFWWKWHGAWEPNRVASLEIIPTNIHILEQNTARFYVLSFDDAGRQILPSPVNWTFTSDRTIGRISQDGTFRALIPGSGTLTAATGSVQASTPVTIELDETRWLELETKHASILYRPPVQRQALYTQAVIGPLMEKVRSQLGTTFPSAKTRFILTTDEFEFYDVTGLSIYDALAVYYGDTIAVAPTAWTQGDIESYDLTLPIEEEFSSMIISHEYTHQLHDAALSDTLFSDFGIMPVNRDLWFVEGLADFVASGFDENSYQALTEATERDHLLSFADMQGETVWDRPDEDITLIYAEGYSVFVYLEQTVGPDFLLPYFAALNEGSDSNTAFVKAFGKSAAVIEPEWKVWLHKTVRSLTYATYDSTAESI
ncbi:hypothetical protein AUK40_05715 [Candidatus Wirthbacteria bacterium CG2_30_54_11]|uniref:Peptidase MA-like domain-containing protein n=1 Tax=Candidatus Wirthbacteria bacterium CG2_30_54_11 TaxID=1817892 RepID=A0A1J5IX14_9BACT|nr:MAG: hypothetical protein AUK40_05715 [Candidatus Wirthbacteria bacterium CG2_30_54_11]